jgi:hypothetical protein
MASGHVFFDLGFCAAARNVVIGTGFVNLNFIVMSGPKAVPGPRILRY